MVMPSMKEYTKGKASIRAFGQCDRKLKLWALTQGKKIAPNEGWG